MPGAVLSLDVVGDTLVVWDRDRIAQVVSNLLANAVQHGARGGTVSLRVDGERSERVLLQIRNQGCVDEELIPVTRQLLLGHEGEIRLTSSAEDGTCFEIDLPRVARAEAAS